jgi:hypothetical protein
VWLRSGGQTRVACQTAGSRQKRTQSTLTVLQEDESSLKNPFFEIAEAEMCRDSSINAIRDETLFYLIIYSEFLMLSYF